MDELTFHQKMRDSMEKCLWKSVLFYADAILNEKKDDFEAIFCRSFALYSTKNFRELESWLSSLPQHLQYNEQLLIIRCKALLQNKDFSSVLSLLSNDDQGLLQSPTKVQSTISRSQILTEFKNECLFNLGKTEILPQSSEKAREELSSVEKLDPLHPQVITQCIVDAMMQKDPSKIQKFTLLTDKRSEDNAYIVTACACYNILNKQLDSGQAFLMKATEIDPDCEISWLCLIYLLMETGEWDQALSTLKTVNLRFPMSSSATMFGISIHLRSGSPSLAMPWIEKIGLVNDFVKHEAAVAQMMDGSYGAALSVFIGIERSGDDADLRCSSAINAGHCLRRTGKFEEALEHYNHSLSFGLNQKEALVAIAFTYHLTNRIDDAIIFYNKCLAIDPFHPFATKMLNVALVNN